MSLKRSDSGVESISDLQTAPSSSSDIVAVADLTASSGLKVIATSTSLDLAATSTSASVSDEGKKYTNSPSELAVVREPPSMTGIDLEEFHCFKKLPIELRFKIWKEAFYLTEMPGVCYSPSLQEGKATLNGCCTPVMLQVCRESRSECLKFCSPYLFKYEFGTSETGQTVIQHEDLPLFHTEGAVIMEKVCYFVPTLDRLMFPGTGFFLSSVDLPGSYPVYFEGQELYPWDAKYFIFGCKSPEHGPLASMARTFRNLSFDKDVWEELCEMPKFYETFLKEYPLVEDIVIDWVSYRYDAERALGQISWYLKYLVRTDIQEVLEQWKNSREKVMDELIQSLENLFQETLDLMKEWERSRPGEFKELKETLQSDWQKKAEAWIEKENQSGRKERKIPILTVVGFVENGYDPAQVRSTIEKGVRKILSKELGAEI